MKRRTLLAAAVLTCSPAWPQTEPGGRFPETLLLEPDGLRLARAGEGVFRFLFIRYYACALYAAPDLTDALRVLAADLPRRVAIMALRRISAFEFLWGLDRGLADNVDANERRMLAADLDRLRAVIRAAGRIEAGTAVDIDYLPGRGVRVAVSGVAQGPALGSKPLADALLKVWIGERPLDTALKAALLGRRPEQPALR